MGGSRRGPLTGSAARRKYYRLCSCAVVVVVVAAAAAAANVQFITTLLKSLYQILTTVAIQYVRTLCRRL